MTFLVIRSRITTNVFIFSHFTMVNSLYSTIIVLMILGTDPVINSEKY